MSFYLDGPLFHTEMTAPWDFNNNDANGCIPYAFAGGSHTIRATFSGGEVSSTFTVGSAPPPPPPPLPPPAAPTTTTCNLYAAPNGSDSNSGSITSPFRTPTRLDQALAPGQTGCLRGGTYGTISTEHKIDKPGTANARITITAYPGETPSVVGWMHIDGAYTTVSYIRQDGSNTFGGGGNCPALGNRAEGLHIGGTAVILEHSDIFQSGATAKGNGIGIGWWGNPDYAVVRYNKIHDVGGCQNYDHGIYLGHGNGVQIYDNWIWNASKGWGVQVYPGPTNAKIYSNVMDKTGSGLTICGSASGNQVYRNVIVNQTGLPGITSGAAISGCPPTSSGNQFVNNDAFNNPGGIGSVANVTMSNNVTTDPQFVDAAAHNYQITSTSPLASWGLWNGG